MQIYSQVYSLKTVIEETPMPFAHWTQCRLAAFLWVQKHVVNCPGENCPNAFTLRRATPVMRAHRACFYATSFRLLTFSPDCRPLLIDKMPLAEPPPARHPV